jgi:DNA recombination protein RmuC
MFGQTGLTVADLLLWVAAGGAVLATIGAWLAWRRAGNSSASRWEALLDGQASLDEKQERLLEQQARLERSLRDDFAAGQRELRQETADATRGLRADLLQALAQGQMVSSTRQADQAKVLNQQLDGFAQNLTALSTQLQDRFELLRSSLTAESKTDREASGAALGTFADRLSETMRAVGESSNNRQAEHAQGVNRQLETFTQNLGTLTNQLQERFEALRASLTSEAKDDRETSAAALAGFGDRLTDTLNKLNEASEQRIGAVRETVESRLKDLQSDNASKLEAMRQTVDEKLHATLEHRLGESFKLVSDRLDAVHKGLGEMQTLATGVGDLKRVLTNVRSRGTWGEVQLGMLIEQTMTPDQYGRNVKPVPGSAEVVEFAIKLPGRELDGAPVWLPIDSKFPKEEYERLCDAQERADVEGVRVAGMAFERGVEGEGRRIQTKYVQPPHTTDFALMFLPTEGLYAEVLRRPALMDKLQALRINVAGPSTLAALLNSLQMGFRTLAIEQRSSEVWKVLGAIKTEFLKFGEVLGSVKRSLDAASSKIGKTEVRARAMQRHLRGVEALPEAEAVALLGAADTALQDETETALDLAAPAEDEDLATIGRTGN